MSDHKVKGYIVPKEFKGSCLNVLCEDEDGIEFLPYTNLSLSEYIAKNADKGAHVVSRQEFDALYDVHLASMVSDPRVVDEDRYDYLLCVMPPCRWHHSKGVELFHIVERITGNLVTWCAVYNDVYYEFEDYCNASSEKLVEKILKVSAAEGR